MAKIIVNVRLYMQIEIIYFNIISLYLNDELDDKFWDYEIYCDGEKIKRFNNPVLNENNSFEFKFKSEVKDRKAIASLTLYDFFKNYVTLEDNARTQFIPLYSNGLVTALISSNKIYVVKNDGSAFTKEDFSAVLSIWNQMLSDYIDDYGSVSFENDLKTLTTIDNRIYRLNFKGLNFEQEIVEELESIKLNHILPS